MIHGICPFIHEVKSKLEGLARDPSSETYTNFIDLKEFKTFYHMFLDYKLMLRDSGGQLICFWLSFLEMVEILLNTIYATRAGKWILLLESYRDMIPYIFAYDHLNYAKYLTTLLPELTNLENSHPEIYEEFMNGNFSVQLSTKNPFGRIELDKVIETTINKDTKCPGGLKGFSCDINQVNRWTLNAAHRADLRRCMHDLLRYNTCSVVHNDLNQSRIKKDIDRVRSIVEVVKETFINPFQFDCELVCISSGLEA